MHACTPRNKGSLQDPSYPVYVDSTVLMGNTGEMDVSSGQFDNMTYMSCLPDNGFFPDLANTPRTGALHV